MRPIGAMMGQQDRARQRKNERRLEQGVAADLWSDLKKQSRRLGAVHIQASEVNLYIGRRGKLGELNDAIILDAKAAVPKFQQSPSSPQSPTSRSSSKPQALAEVEVEREDTSAFNLPSYILELQQIAAEDKEIDDREAAGVGLVDIGSGLGAAAAAAVAPLWDLVSPDANSGPVSPSNGDASPRTGARRHLTILPPAAPELPPPSPSAPLMPLIETIPQHYPSDLLWEHSMFMMSAQQVRWEMGRDGIRPKAMRAEYGPKVCKERSFFSRPSSASKQGRPERHPSPQRTSPVARPTPTIAAELEIATPPPPQPLSGHVPQGVLPRTVAISPRYTRAAMGMGLGRRWGGTAVRPVAAQFYSQQAPGDAESQSPTTLGAQRVLCEQLHESAPPTSPHGSPEGTPRARMYSSISSRPASAESQGRRRSGCSTPSSVASLTTKRSATPWGSNNRSAPSPVRRI